MAPSIFATIRGVPAFTERLDKLVLKQPYSTFFNSHVLSLLQNIMTEQKEMRKIVNQLAPTPKTLPDDCPQFPVNTPDDMLVFNKYLGSRGNFTKLCRFFENIGGADSNNTVRRILQSIMTNGLSLKYNWKGQGEKEAFSQYKHVINLVSVSVRNNPVCEKATDHEIETCIKKWLVHAKDREFGRSNRPYQRSTKPSSQNTSNLY